MLRFVADENFNHAIIRGLFRLNPSLDLLTVQDASLTGMSDPDLLDWAATQGRVLLTHDVQTMRNYATKRTAAGQAMPGVVEVPAICPVGQVFKDIILLCECSMSGEWEGQIVRIPL